MCDAVFRSCLNVRLAVAHCNFHLRGEESDGDEAFVRGFAQGLGLECHVQDFDTEGYAREHGISIEMAARELRYRWFDRLCREHGFGAVCVAHNANDNAETLMLNLLRGCGIKGLCGMEYMGRNPYGDSMVCRPMLEYTRADIEAYAAQRGLKWREDSTNAESMCKRNILRNEVFPLLAQINPSFVRTFASDISHFRQGAAALDEYIDASDFKAVPGGCTIALDRLMANSHWKFLLYNIMAAYGFGSAVIASVQDLLSSDRQVAGKRFVSDEYQLVCTTNSLVFSLLNAESRLPSVELIDWIPGSDPRTERGVILLDADRLDGAPQLRRWEDGDYLIPIGMKGRKKVSDMLTDLKYPLSLKDSALVVSGEGRHVLALVGERVDSSVKVTASTRRVWKITCPGTPWD